MWLVMGDLHGVVVAEWVGRGGVVFTVYDAPAAVGGEVGFYGLH